MGNSGDRKWAGKENLWSIMQSAQESTQFATKPSSQFFTQQSVPIWAMGCQLLQEGTVGDSVEGLAEV